MSETGNYIAIPGISLIEPTSECEPSGSPNDYISKKVVRNNQQNLTQFNDKRPSPRGCIPFPR